VAACITANRILRKRENAKCIEEGEHQGRKFGKEVQDACITKEGVLFGVHCGGKEWDQTLIYLSLARSGKGGSPDMGGGTWQNEEAREVEENTKSNGREIASSGNKHFT